MGLTIDTNTSKYTLISLMNISGFSSLIAIIKIGKSFYIDTCCSYNNMYHK